MIALFIAHYNFVNSWQFENDASRRKWFGDKQMER
jgi:hypothetical protein